jgi:predicted small metal-binding protein
MAKVLRCNDLMPGCPFEARGTSEEEVLAQAAEHAKTAHGMTEIPEGMVSAVRGAIHDEDQASAQTAGS